MPVYIYPPGNYITLTTLGKEDHLQECLDRGYVRSQEGISLQFSGQGWLFVAFWPNGWYSKYCWWNKFCSSCWVVYPIIDRVFYIQTVVVWDIWTINSSSFMSFLRLVVTKTLWTVFLRLCFGLRHGELFYEGIGQLGFQDRATAWRMPPRWRKQKAPRQQKGHGDNQASFVEYHGNLQPALMFWWL